MRVEQAGALLFGDVRAYWTIGVTAVKKRAHTAELRKEAFKLRDEGWEPDDVAELLELNKWTIAGWLSWRTKGYYDGEDKS